jgi:VCBS repeat-containing protein
VANTPLSVPAATGVLANDTDAEHDPLSALLVGAPAHGTLTLNADGSFTYTPASGFMGSDAFTYVAQDIDGQSNVATVTIAVKAPGVFATGTDAGGGPQVNVYDAQGHLIFTFMAYSPFFLGGVRVAVGDVNGDGLPEVITVPGPGGGPDVRIWDVTSTGATMIGEFNAYSPFFIGGQFVATGDVNGDGKAEIIIGPDAGGGPDMKVFDLSGHVLQEFLAYGPFFIGGVRVAAGDVNGHGKADIITGAGPSGGPNVQIFDGANPGKLLQSYLAFGPFFTGGVYVAAADVNGDVHADVIAGAGPTGGPNVVVFDGTNPAHVLKDFNAYGPFFQGGVRVAATEFNGQAAIVTGAGPSGGPNVVVFDATNPSNNNALDDFFAYDQAFLGGIFVGGG